MNYWLVCMFLNYHSVQRTYLQFILTIEIRYCFFVYLFLARLLKKRELLSWPWRRRRRRRGRPVKVFCSALLFFCLVCYMSDFSIHHKEVGRFLKHLILSHLQQIGSRRLWKPKTFEQFQPLSQWFPKSSAGGKRLAFT